jgi:hypothetical protein
MDVKERIQKYLDYKGIRTASFEKEVGLSNGYWRKTKSISANIVSEILRAYSDLSSRWVIFGEGAMCCPSSTDTDQSFYHPSDDGTYNGLTTDLHGRKEGGSPDVRDERIKLLEEKVQFLQEQVEFYKSRNKQ